MSVTPARGSTAPSSIPAAIWVAILRVELVTKESFSQGTSYESQLVTGVQHNEKIEMKTSCKGGLASLGRGFPPAPSSSTQATGHLPPTPLYFNFKDQHFWKVAHTWSSDMVIWLLPLCSERGNWISSVPTDLSSKHWARNVVSFPKLYLSSLSWNVIYKCQYFDKDITFCVYFQCK